MKTTFTALDELELQDWRNQRNDYGKECSITRSYAAALVKHYGAKMPKPGECVRLCDFRGLVLHNHGTDCTLSARQL